MAEMTRYERIMTASRKKRADRLPFNDSKPKEACRQVTVLSLLET